MTPLARNRLSMFGLVTTALIAATPAQAAERTGKDVVNAVCAGCHTSGKDGAPKIGDVADWAPRAAKGLDKLSENAIKGVRNMPAHGGQLSLTDLEMTRAVAYMVSGGNTPDPVKPYSSSERRSGEQVVAQTCGTCHKEGTNGAPKLGDFAAWKARLPKGVEALVASAVNGHNNMPQRGGMGSLSDADIRAAVQYMVSAAR